MGPENRAANDWIRGAHASRVLVSASRQNDLFRAAPWDALSLTKVRDSRKRSPLLGKRTLPDTPLLRVR